MISGSNVVYALCFVSSGIEYKQEGITKLGDISISRLSSVKS